jgi:hypothetical protein
LQPPRDHLGATLLDGVTTLASKERKKEGEEWKMSPQNEKGASVAHSD